MANINNFRKRFFSRGKLLALTSLALLVVISLNHPLSAQSVAQGYSADQPLERGMLVAVKLNDPTKVEPVTANALDRLKGVIVQPNDIPVTISNDGQKVFVATGGTYEVLISDQGGAIKAGDYISISSLPGIGMKAGESQAIVLGRAITDFKGKEDTLGSSEVQIGDKKTQVKFGRIQVSVSINRNPGLKVPDTPQIPKLLDKVSKIIVNKSVSPQKVYLATAIFIATSIISGIMLYSGARSSLISIGRNPLSRKVIVRGLIQVVILSLIIFITGMFGVYLLLKL